MSRASTSGRMRVWLIILIVFVASAAGAAAAQDLRSGVVKVTSKSPPSSESAEGQRRTGTGFIVKLEPEAVFIVTAAHVVEGDISPKVEFFTRQNLPVAAEVKRLELQLDMALLIVSDRGRIPEGLRPFAFGSDQALLGQDVTIIGFPPGLNPWALTKPVVSGDEGVQLVLSGAIDQGNSGGPVLKDGAVVGMVTQAQRQSGRALPAQILQRVLERSWGVAVGDGPSSGAPSPEAARPPATPSEPRAAPKPLSVTAWWPGETFMDCTDFCPEMVVVPAGSFQMGSPDSEKGHFSNEGSVHQVTIPAPFAVSKFEITREQFARFVRATGRDMSGGCWLWDDKEGKAKLDSAKNWLDPGFAQSDEHPVVCVSFEDATAYVEWLAKQTGKPYRLLSEAEWEYAARAGTTASRFWGDSEQRACDYANVVDRKAKSKHPNWAAFDCDDGYEETAPVGKYKPNAFRLYDMLGNAWEWVQDCWNDSYEGAPTNGSAWVSGECDKPVVRGGSWSSDTDDVRSAIRARSSATSRLSSFGFRIGRSRPVPSGDRGRAGAQGSVQGQS